MSHKPQAFHILQDSVEDSSWATISVSDNTDSISDCDEESLDATLPIDDLDVEEVKIIKNAKGMHHPCVVFPKIISAVPTESPLLPLSMKEFCPPYCSTAKLYSGQIIQDSCSNNTPHYVCSSKSEKENLGHNGMDADVKRRLYQQKVLRQPAPIMCEILKLNLPHRLSSVNRIESEEFRPQPQHCSTARSESELKFQRCISELPETSNLFLPTRCSSELVQSTMDHPVPMTQSEFKPQRCSTELRQDSSLAFMPLRCSTDLNDSAAFNPILSSTAHLCAADDILNLQYLKMSSDSCFRK